MEPDALTPWLLVIKLVLYGASLAAIGLGFHVATGIVPADGQKRALRWAALLALLALLAGAARLVVTSAELAGGFSGALAPANFGMVWQFQAPAFWAMMAGGVLFIAAAATTNRWLVLPAALALSAAFALTGHSQGVSEPLASPLAVTVHVAIAGFWIVAPLTLWPRKDVGNDALHARLEDFSRFAVIAVPILFALGLWLVVRLAGGATQLITSLYGRLLIAKLVAAGAALALGALNKTVITRHIKRHPEIGRRALARSLALEAALFVAALMLVAWATTMTGPPEA